MQEISLEWARDARGYHLVEPTPPHTVSPPTNSNMLFGMSQGFVVVPDVTLPEGWRYAHPLDRAAKPQRIVPAGGSLVPYRATDTLDLIFREFLSTDPSAKGVFDFIGRFGPLTRAGNTEEGELVDPVIDLLNFMTEIIDLGASSKEVQKRALVDFLGADGVCLSGVEVRLIFDERTQALRTRQVAIDLRTALTLRLYEVMVSDIVLRRCGHCSALFTAGLGTGRHLNAKFCSDEHRVLFNSLKRTPKAA